MFKDITLGQYYPTDSILHKLDPRVKFIGTIAFIIALFLIKGPVGYGLATVVLVTLIRLSKVPASPFTRERRPIRTSSALSGMKPRRHMFSAMQLPQAL